MSRRLVGLVVAIAAFSFVYLHFEFFPSRVGPDPETARTEIQQWVLKAGGQTFSDLSVKRIHARNEAGISVADVEFRQLYYEANGLGQRYTGEGKVEFVRMGRLFRPAWTIARVRLVDKDRLP
jgi:hypothetical protein